MSLISRSVRSFAMAATESVAKKVPIPRRGVDYRGKVVLAPMVRSGELPCRLVALHYGADLVWGPETIDRAMIGTTRRVNPATNTIEWTRPSSNHQHTPPEMVKESVIFKMHPELEAGRLIFQIGSSDPARAVEAARLVAGDVAGVDVNAGCPKPFSTTGGMGAALLRDPDRLCAILEALVGELTKSPFEIGVSVKIRILPDPLETEALVRRLVATGISGLTVHCRTPSMRPREAAIRGQLRMVANICREAGVACLMNGDVEDRDKALALADEFGADGAMIAIAAEKNSSCFRSAADGGFAPWDEVATALLKYALDVENRFGNTKFSMNNVIPGRRPQHLPIQQAKSYTAICEILDLPQETIDRAREVDEALGLDKPPPEKPGKKKKKGADSPAALASGGNMAKARKADAKPPRPLSARGVTSPLLAEPLLAETQPALDCA